MGITVEATYEEGVFKPLARVDLAEHERVRLTIDRGDIVTERRGRRVLLDAETARAIAEDPELGRRS